MPQFDAFEDFVGRWRWRLSTDEGRVVATSGESYESHWHAMRAAEDVRGVATAAQMSEVPSQGLGDPLEALVEREVGLAKAGNPSMT